MHFGHYEFYNSF